MEKSGAVGRMVDAVGPGHRVEVARVDAIEVGGVHPVFVRVRAAPVVGVDAAGLAEPVLRRAGAPLVERQVVGALDDRDPVERCGDRDRAAAAQNEQSQRRAVARPSLSVTASSTAPQWQVTRCGLRFRAASQRLLRHDRDRRGVAAPGWGGRRRCGPEAGAPRRSQTGRVRTSPATKPPAWAQ